MQQSYFKPLLRIRGEALDLATVFGYAYRLYYSLNSANKRDHEAMRGAALEYRLVH
jgi:hypothetical protein